jgi:Flp pilus assembly protein TadG
MRLRHPLPRRRAATLVETAFVISIALLFLFGIFEYCRFIFLLQVCENAAREGARYAVSRTGDGVTDATAIQNYVTDRMEGRQSDLSGFAVTVDNVDPSTGNAIPNTNWNDAPFGGAIMVRVSGTYVPMLPSFLHTQTSIPIRATSMMSSEAN